MITAEDVRKDLKISENTTIKDIFMDYFQNTIERLKKENQSVILKTFTPYGMTIDINQILMEYGLNEDIIPKNILSKEVNQFLKDLESLGFKVCGRKIFNEKWEKRFSICWLKHFEKPKEETCDFI